LPILANLCLLLAHRELEIGNLLRVVQELTCLLCFIAIAIVLIFIILVFTLIFVILIAVLSLEFIAVGPPRCPNITGLGMASRGLLV
jgi:hypothetical protein